TSAIFDPRFNEFRGVIVAGNPVFMFAGRFPVGIEFYQQEHLGHEFEFVGVRDPFFMADEKIPSGKLFKRGYSISIKQKFYNPMKAGMWYFGHEVRFTNLGHFVNIATMTGPDNIFTVSSVEQRIEWGVLLGYRLMRRNNARGFTLDAFVSVDVGYRGFDADSQYEVYFQNLNHSSLSTSFHFGLNLGNVFSFK
ncbi:MAG: membrane-binding protein, partial [Bacteroidia bacterium]|nr:membrane-binding protein [Bacteroidia bacterium]